jgi:hypothetical protein
MMTPKLSRTTPKSSWPETTEAEPGELSPPPGRLRLILQRAGLLYLALLVGLSTLLSLAGIDPLIHNGALPKGLLLYVGLATLLALANNDETSLIKGQSRGWLALFPGRSDRNR